MAQRAAKAKKRPDISGEKFKGMETAEVLNAINLDPAKHKGLRVYKGKIYIGGAHGLNYGKEITAFQVLYNSMIDNGIIRGKRIKEDGKYGSETRRAIFNLQRQINKNLGMGIHVDGYFGAETWAGTQALLEGKLSYVPKKEEAPVVEEKTLEDFSAKVRKVRKKSSSPNERFEWDEEYSQGLYEMGVVDRDDYGNYQLTENAKNYLETYNKRQKKDWRVGESDLEQAINDPQKFKNKHAKAVEYIISRYEKERREREETGTTPTEGGLPGVGEGRGEEEAGAPPAPKEEELIPPEIYAQLTDKEKTKADRIADIIANERDEDAKKKMMAAIERWKMQSDYAKLQMLENDILPGDVRKNLIAMGSELAG